MTSEEDPLWPYQQQNVSLRAIIGCLISFHEVIVCISGFEADQKIDNLHLQSFKKARLVLIPRLCLRFLDCKIDDHAQSQMYYAGLHLYFACMI